MAEELRTRYATDRASGLRLPWTVRPKSVQENKEGKYYSCFVHRGLRFKDKKLDVLVASGVAMHHAGIDYADRLAIEEGFRSGSVKVIVCTSTLAVGVNLPAHTVIISGTKMWDGKKMIEYPDIEVQVRCFLLLVPLPRTEPLV